MWEGSLDRFQRMKRDRIANILYELYERDGEAELREFSGSIAVNYGIRRQTLSEYLEDLKAAGIIEVRKDRILLKWSKEKTEDWLEKQGVIALRKEERRKQ